MTDKQYKNEKLDKLHYSNYDKQLAINMLKYTTTDADIFKVFLDYMLNYLKQEEKENKDIGIILDNCSIHRANTVREYCRRMNIRMYYLPQYSPEQAQ